MKKISAFLSFLLGGALLLLAAGCTPQEGGSDAVVSDHTYTSSTAQGIDKEDPYTWFDGNKEVLPSRAQCGEIAVGMRLNEVIKKLGKPQRDIGSGAWVFQFDVADGSVFTVTFILDPEGDSKGESDAHSKAEPTGDFTRDFTGDFTADASTYDELIVYAFTFDTEVPERYFPQQKVLRELYPWMGELDAGDVSKVRYEHANIGVVPFLLKDIAYSADEADIFNACSLFSMPIHAISQSEGQVEGGGYVKYDFITPEETYSVMISNHTVWIDGQYYRVDGKLFEMTSPALECHSFITYPFCDSYEIATYDEESVTVGEFEGLGEFEFTVYGGLIEHAPQYYLRADGLTLLILSANQFLIEGDVNTVVYQITGDKDFSELFD